MNVKLFMMAALASSALFFTACDDDDNGYLPSETVTKAFSNKYPNAQRVSWENKGGYMEVDFYDGSYEAEAWFNLDGKWIQTDTDIPYQALPEAVRKSFESSTYASWKQDDIDKLERAEKSIVYIIEVEKGEQDVDLRYAENGELIKDWI